MGGPKSNNASITNAPVQRAPVQQCSECDGKENEICNNFIPKNLNTSKCSRCSHKKESHINEICDNFIPDNLNNLKCGSCGHTKESHNKHKIHMSIPRSNVPSNPTSAATKVIGGRLPYKSRTKKHIQRRHKKRTRRHKKN